MVNWQIFWIALALVGSIYLWLLFLCGSLYWVSRHGE